MQFDVALDHQDVRLIAVHHAAVVIIYPSIYLLCSIPKF